jgi:DNA-binding transcriptional regulator YiaG
MTPEEFVEHLKSSGLNTRELADLLHVSFPTVERWMEGRNCPHPSMRFLVVSALPTALDRIVDALGD